MFATGGFGVFASALLSLSAITCATLLIGGWRRRQHLMARHHGSVPWQPAPPPFGPGQAPFASFPLDVAAEARDLLHHMAPEAARDLVQLEFAVPPGLTVHADRLALRTVLSELIANAVRHTPGGRVLLSAIELGGRVQIAVIDDGAGADAATQEAALREVAQLVALQGGTIDIDTWRGEGTTVIVRLPDPAQATRPSGEAPRPRPTARPAATSRAALEPVAEHSWDI